MKRTDILYTESVAELRRTVPELEQDYQQQVREWASDEPHAHVVFGSTFSAFIRRIQATVNNDRDSKKDDLLARCFQFIEELASSSDFESRCLIEASVLESLLGNEREDWQRFSPYFGQQTKLMAVRLMKQWGKDNLG